MKEHREPTDYPRDVIIEMAKQAVAQSHTPVEVLFKFTCAHCGERCTFQEPNTLYEYGECCACGKETKVDRAGYALAYHFNRLPK